MQAISLIICLQLYTKATEYYSRFTFVFHHPLARKGNSCSQYNLHTVSRYTSNSLSRRHTVLLMLEPHSMVSLASESEHDRTDDVLELNPKHIYRLQSVAVKLLDLRLYSTSASSYGKALWLCPRSIPGMNGSGERRFRRPELSGQTEAVKDGCCHASDWVSAQTGRASACQSWTVYVIISGMFPCCEAQWISPGESR